MIRFSALLVALAIGLLVAGVAASNLPLVYVSIAVCAVAALLLAAGVLRHWSEIFGTATKRPASPFAASQRVPSPAPAGWTRQTGQVGIPGLAGFRADAGTGDAGAGSVARKPEPAAASGEYQPAWRPAEAEPEPAPAEPSYAAPADDLWDRVNEELESAGKRDSGRLSWPAGDFSIPSGMSLPPEPPEHERLAGPGPSAGSDLWQPAAGWQPPTTPQGNWPFAPPAEPASAGSARRDDGWASDRDSDQDSDRDSAAEPTDRDEPTQGARGWDAPSRADRDRDDRDRDDRAPDETGPADEDAAPRWTIQPQPAPGTASTVVSTPPVVTPAGAPEPSQAAEPGKSGPGAAPAEPARTGKSATAETAEPAEATKPAAAAEAAKPAEPVKAASTVKPAEPAESGAAAKPAAPAEPVDVAEAGSAGQPATAGKRAGDSKPATSGAPDSAATQVGATQVTAPPKVDPAKAEPAQADAARTGPATAGAAKAGTGQREAGQDTASDSPEKPAKPAKPAGPAQVTVVPGVARYHRGECILIRFLGEDDLEIMPKQQAVAAGLTACRACQPDQLPDS